MIEYTIIIPIAKWLAEVSLGDAIVTQVKRKFNKDPFSEIAKKAFEEVLKQNKEHIILLNDIERKIEGLDKKELLNYTDDDFCNLLPDQKRECCKEFFNKIKEEYVKTIYENASTPEIKYALDLLKDHEDRIKKLEAVYPKIKEILEKEEIYLEKRISEVKRNIESEKSNIETQLEACRSYLRKKKCLSIHIRCVVIKYRKQNE